MHKWLFGNGTVGSQSLVGIPRLEDLRLRFGDKLRVWPFEMGSGSVIETCVAPITLAEIWPGAIEFNGAHQEVKDATQTKSMVDWCGGRDECADWSTWLRPMSMHQQPERIAEEGRILGVQ